jgi:hypothetical protein
MARRRGGPPARPRRGDAPDPGASTGVLSTPPSAPADDPLIGRTVGRCVVAARIGVGRTSVVYRARHTGIDRDVALKVLLPEAVAQPALVEKFEVEARAIARLDHENILKIYDVFREGDLHGIVMELLEGETVLDLVEREERVEPLDAMRIVKQAALGLGAAHAKQILHRDVKPQNLVLLPDGVVKVVDFGLAAEAEPGLAGSRIGTPHYMAPEIWEARPAGTTSDVYALGITLYHVLVGQPPYAGLTVKDIHAGHLAGLPLQPDRRVPRLPRPLADLVRDMTNREASARPEMVQVVERIDSIGGEEIRTKAGVRLRRRASRASTFGGGGRARTPAWPMAVGALAVVGVAVALVAGSGSGGSGGPATPRTGQAPPPVDPEVERRLREQREKAAAQAALEADARQALEGAASFARESWEDKSGVVRRYRGIAERFKGTAAAEEAKRRAEGIVRGTVHPHPDRKVVPKETVEAAAKVWEAARPEYEAAIGRKQYDLALTLVPVGIEDAMGSVAEEVLFHRALARDLGEFLSTLRRAITAMPESARRIALEGGEHRIQAVTDTGLLVHGPDGQKKVAWGDVPPAALFDLAIGAFREKGTREATFLVAAAYAHRMPDRFWTALLQARAGTPTKEESAALDGYEKRAAARLGS